MVAMILVIAHNAVMDCPSPDPILNAMCGGGGEDDLDDEDEDDDLDDAISFSISCIVGIFNRRDSCVVASVRYW